MPDKMTGLDSGKAKETAQRVVADVATAMHCALSYIGDKLGIFKAMADAGPITSSGLAQETGLSERYLREWLGSMAAAQYVEYDPGAATYHLAPEYAAALAEESSPFFVAGYFEMVLATVTVAPKVARVFRTGKGVPQGEYLPEMFQAAERNSRTRYEHKLVRKWLPAMPQAVEKLRAGGSAADVGCGGGRAAILIAQAFPKAAVFGFDLHAESIERARANAAAAGLGERTRFEVADGAHLPERRFDLVSTFDVVHDAVDPVGLMSSIRRSLCDDGTYLMQEINTSARVEDNIKPMGKMLYSVSTLYCMTTSLAHGGAGIGALMGEPKARDLAAAAGFSRFRRLPVDDDFAVLYELQP